MDLCYIKLIRKFYIMADCGIFMGILEDRLVRIVELRKNGMDNEAVAREIGLDISTLEMYESSTRKAIEGVITNGVYGLEKIAAKVGLAPVILNMVADVYGISIPERDEKRKRRRSNVESIELIRKAVEEGVDSISKISGITGLSGVTVINYAQSAGIELPKVSDIGFRRSMRGRIVKENRIEEIKQAIANGAGSVENIAEIVGLAPGTVRQYSSLNGIKLPKVRVRGREGTIELIREIVDEGAESVEDIARAVNRKPSTVYNYLTGEEIGPLILRSEYRKVSERVVQRRLKAIKGAIDNGENSLEELCKVSGLKRSGGVLKYCNRFGIELPEDLIPYRQRPEIDNLIDEGMTLTEIGDEVGVSRERVRQYIAESGQYKSWRVKREEVVHGLKREENKFKKLQSRFISYIRGRMKDLAREESWAIEKAVEHLTSGRNPLKNRHSFSDLVQLFERREAALSSGEVISLSELGKGLFLGTPESVASRVSHIFHKVNVKPMNGNYERKIRIGEKVAAVQRGYGAEFTSPDIAYFLDLPKHIPMSRYSEFRGRNIERNIIKRFGQSGTKGHLTYRLASQIYEAEDSSFNVEESCELFDVNSELVDYALKHRGEIGPKIVRGLRLLYADNDVKTPYVTREMKEKLEKRER
jgi:predicted transcriptional regulator